MTDIQNCIEDISIINKRLIYVDLICEKDSHKGIIIGKNGQTLKKIGETARFELEKFLRAKVNVKIWVKVRKEWRDNQNLLKELGYKAKK